MLFRSYYGGLAITASGTTAVHALSYPLGGKYHIAHGAVSYTHLVIYMEIPLLSLALRKNNVVNLTTLFSGNWGINV